VLPFARSREAERLQQALDGRLRAAELTPTLGGYAAVAGRLSELVPTTALHPSPEYRAELHTRLVELATARAAGRPAPLADRRASTDRRAVLPWLAGLLTTWSRRGWRRSLAAATGALLTLCVGVGFAAGSALPGGLLYPVKELIQSAQVQLAGGGLDRGTVLLDQARGHLRDAGTLVGQGSPDPADVDTALRAASADLSDAQRTLLAQFARSHDPAALTALARFATDQSPVLATLRGRVPVVSEPLVDQLLGQLGTLATAVRTAAAQCGPACAVVPVSDLPGTDGLLGGPGSGSGAGSLAGSSGLGSTGGVNGTSGSGGTGLGGLLGAPGSGANGAGTGGVSAGGVSVGTGGVGVQAPGVSATVPAPSVGAGSGGVQATVPPASVTLGPVTATLPGVGVTVPPPLPSSHSSGAAASATGSSSSSSIWVLVVCVG
jgi:hypothetical protein